MWIYEQTKPEENFSLLPQVASLPVQKVEPALPPVPVSYTHLTLPTKLEV